MTLERFERAGDTVAGVWVTYHNGADRHREILRHEYTIVLARDDRPRSVHLLLRHPGGPVEHTFDVQFTDDTVYVLVAPDSTPRRSIVARHAYPTLGSSMAMFEAIVTAANNQRQAPDSATVVTVAVTGPFVAQSIPVALTGEHSVRLGQRGGPTLYTGAGGAIDSIAAANGQVPLRRVAPFDIDAISLAAQQSIRTPAQPPR